MKLNQAKITVKEPRYLEALKTIAEAEEAKAEVKTEAEAEEDVD